jgi:3-deoxy-D-manno-octulosonate 8-phosphate phosphatase (KDO 8-P phosphatase)
MSLEICYKIKLVLLDVDGVMTDGSIYINEEGECFKSFDVKDGLAIELLRCHGIKTGVISGKSSKSLDNRCAQLGLDVVVTGCKNKLPALMKICSDFGLSFDEIAFLGDDVLDIPLFEKVGLSAAPSDAHTLALNSASWVTNSRGGNGMVREFADKLLTYQLGLELPDIYAPLLEKIRLDDVSEMEQ